MPAEIVGTARDLPVGELLLADRLDAVSVVERVPELGDNEELLTLDEAVSYGACDALPAFLLVSVVCGESIAVSGASVIWLILPV